MGIGPAVLGLYTRLKRQGVFDGVDRVMELGSQDVWTNNPDLVIELFVAFRRSVVGNISDYMGWATGRVPSRQLHRDLGLKYGCIDLDGRHGAIRLDFNSQGVPDAALGAYDLVTNHGTTEHVFNQANVFKVMHDLCRSGGLMLHAVPVGAGYPDHGFFSYQPNLFTALAKYNDYEILGQWLHQRPAVPDIVECKPPSDQQSKPGPDDVMIVLYRKCRSHPFRAPIQACYENTIGKP